MVAGRGLRDDGRRSEHGRRLRRAARPRLRRVLRARGVHGGLARVAARTADRAATSSSEASGSRRASAGSTSRSGSCSSRRPSSRAVGGIMIGLPTLRLRGDYLAIVTLGFGEIVAEVARNGDKETLGFNLTSGPPGINPIDPPGFGVWLSDPRRPARELPREVGHVRELRRASSTGRRSCLLLITIFCSIRLRDSRLGRAWIAIREDEVAAAAMGIPLMRTKTWAYALRRLLRRRRRRLVRLLQAGRLPRRLLLRDLDLHPLAWSSSAGWGTCGVSSPAPPSSRT